MPDPRDRDIGDYTATPPSFGFAAFRWISGRLQPLGRARRGVVGPSGGRQQLRSFASGRRLEVLGRSQGRHGGGTSPKPGVAAVPRWLQLARVRSRPRSPALASIWPHLGHKRPPGTPADHRCFRRSAAMCPLLAAPQHALLIRRLPVRVRPGAREETSGQRLAGPPLESRTRFARRHVWNVAPTRGGGRRAAAPPRYRLQAIADGRRWPPADIAAAAGDARATRPSATIWTKRRVPSAGMPGA